MDTEAVDGFVLRVKVLGKAVAAKVEVWPGDDDVHCDCGDRADPCVHAVASLVALKNGWALRSDGAAGFGTQATLLYRLIENEGWLEFVRAIRDPAGMENPLRDSLVAYVGGTASGRLAGPALTPTREDFKVEQVLVELELQGLVAPRAPHGFFRVTAAGMPALFSALRDVARLEFEGSAVEARRDPIRPRLRIVDAGTGIEVVEDSKPAPAARDFSNGARFEGGVFRPLHRLSNDLRAAIGKKFRSEDFATFVSKTLPLLQSEAELLVETSRLPEIRDLAPRVELVLGTDSGTGESLSVLAKLVYGDPVVAEVNQGRLEVLAGARMVPVRDERAEKELERKLLDELNLRPRQPVRFWGRDAIEFVRRSAKWRTSGAGAAQAFSVVGELVPRIQASAKGLEVQFGIGASERFPDGIPLDSARVFSAWSAGENLVPLGGGEGWAKIPAEWLNENGALLERFLQMRNPSTIEKVQLADFVFEAGGVLSDDLSRLKHQFLDYQGLPSQKLPSDLRAELRPYQRLGVDWLGFLRDSGMGGLLADDMGLGKTLQALCAIRGRTLVVAPTSVLPAWESQIETFRPALRVNLYYGGSRKLVPGADVVLTSYGTLRQDRALLTAENWDTIVLDEAQQIKNPDSQIARVVHALRGGFRIALTGTPIENRLDDLWSQIQFVQPDLLGTRREFQARLEAGAITERLGELKRKIKPLILRRMKRDVAPELPPKTEVTLYSDLTPEERGAYQTVLAATKAKIVQELSAGGSVLGALEALLRLRQLCAHPSLVPGFENEEFQLSSKLELLREQVSESLALGHSILIFSQWTSFLDLVEKVLRPMEIDFLRLDGSTPNRGELIEKFQSVDGPRVMILSLKAGGVGLTLTKADHVIILDPWWNPAVEDQAADRAHRIGQSQPVLVQRLVARDTVEDRIVQLQAKKRQIAQQVLGGEGEGGSLELTREDLLELLR